MTASTTQKIPRASVRHFLKDSDLSPVEQEEILDLALFLKANPEAETPLSRTESGSRRSVAVIFDKTSTRTRFSFAAGIADLGGEAIIVNPGEAQIGHKESVEDTAKVLERMVAAIVWRTFAQSGLEAMAENANVPVINALSDSYHPCQLLADLMTIREHKGELAGLTLLYTGDGANNMAHSYLLAGATAGMNVIIAAPSDAWPAQEIVEEARFIAGQTGGSVFVTKDPWEKIREADVVVTDTWVSMGQEEQKEERLKKFSPYKVSAELMNEAAQEAVFLHCLPAYRGYEVDASVIDGPRSRVWDEAENRLHAQKALLVWLLRRGESPSSLSPQEISL